MQTKSQAQFWFRRFGFGNFDVKDSPRSGRSIVEHIGIEYLMKITESDHSVSIFSITQKQKITYWNHFNLYEFKKKLYIWLTQRDHPQRDHTTFLKRMIANDETSLTTT